MSISVFFPPAMQHILLTAGFLFATCLSLCAAEPTMAELDKIRDRENNRKALLEDGHKPAVVTGLAILPDGKPAAGCKITGWGRSMVNQGRGVIVPETFTDESGKFTVNVFTKALYWLSIDDPDKVYAAYDQHFELKDEQEKNDVRFQLQPGIPVEGTVIHSDTNEPITGLTISLFHAPGHDKEQSPEERKERERTQQIPRDCELDAEGKFRFIALPGEKYMVTFDSVHSSEPPSEVDAALYDRVFVTEKEPVHLEFKIPTPWRGRLLKKDGSPAAFYRMFCSRRFNYGSHWVFLTTDKDGYFMYYRTFPATVVSVALHKGEWFHRDYGKEEKLPDNPVFQLSTPITAKGRFIRKSTGEPMRNFKFAYCPNWANDKYATTDDSGNFELKELYLGNEAMLFFLNDSESFDVCLTREMIKSFTPSEPDKIAELGVIELEESGWLEPKLLENLPGKEIDIEGTTPSGKVFDAEKYAGKVVLYDFWATWCGPCLAEIPRMKTLYEKYQSKGFEIIGISIDEDLSALEKGLAKHQLPWLVLADAKRKSAGQLTMVNRFAINFVPRCILAGKDGKVITIEARGEKLEAELKRLFGESKRKSPGVSR